MVRVITQKTYDDVVKENIEEFDMSPREAIDDAVKQFEAQGVDLSNIIKDLMVSGTSENHLLVISIKKINEVLKCEPIVFTELVGHLLTIKGECDKDMAHKLMASREGAYGAILGCLEHSGNSQEVVIPSLKAITSLMSGQPDLLDNQGIRAMIILVDTNSTPRDNEIILSTLKWIAMCCVKHERNRQNIFDAEILLHLKNMLETHNDPKVLTELCRVLRYLVLDDDVRVEFGKAHEHARLIAIETLHILTPMLSAFKTNDAFISDILLTIATLVVRHEFCEKVEEAGGLKFILDVMVEFHDSDKLNRQCFKLLKALAGHDDVKRNIIKQGAATLICTALDTHKDVESTAAAGLGCVAALALREVENSQALFEAGIPEVLVQCMNVHGDKLSVQRNASWAIRNMVARCLEQRVKFVELGAEDLLNEALNKFGKEYDQDIKSALRDLGSTVKLEEQWTGRGGKIHTSSANKNDALLEEEEP